MFGHDFLLVFMLAQLFKPIRLIACMFEKNSSHLGWLACLQCMSCQCNGSIAWFFRILHVKPVGCFSCAYSIARTRAITCQAQWVAFKFQCGHCLWRQQMPVVLKKTKTYIEYKLFEKLWTITYMSCFLKSNHMFEEPMISGFSNIACYNASTFCFLFVLLAIIF